ncbi:tetratricopeptide repeat protein [Idiomarina xiamenensis]|uniref:TPR repeat-containing Na+-type flagellar protein n=1 Tax=Idiomarina xiamenensis 10-D-4 TaxID=740709 RepID=K2K7V4_9GAMM|nr:tetratricopeptide repeat protein [Idiomarina xiamenensis]EKE83753.1 TPR repeat-containing Na+-type flagellar protein [Idiomarina xiamenensis 10-D-4]
MQNRNNLIAMFTFISVIANFYASYAYGEEMEAVQLYSDRELIEMIRDNTHLQRVRDTDRCQLVQDVEAQASLEKRPAYQFLYGDMLAWGVCYKTNAELGLHYMQLAAQQGMPEALEQLGRYYHTGRLVQVDTERAIRYLREAASLGNLPAQLRLADILIAGNGSPYDFEQAYHWLHNAVTADRGQHQQIEKKLKALAKLMPASVVERAQQPLT